MASITYEDAVAIHRAHQQGGDEAALAEAKRRWPGLADHVYLVVTARIMRIKIEVPTIPDRTHLPSPGVPEEDNQKRLEARERKRLRAREREREQRERARAGQD